MLVAGWDSFSRNLAKNLNSGFIEIERTVFSDNETRLKFPSQDKIKDQDIIIPIRGKSPMKNPDKPLIETILALNKLNEFGANKICCILPYMFYSRQDKEFRKGEVVSLKIIRKLITDKCDLMINVLAHDFREEGWINEKIYNIDGVQSVLNFLKGQRYKNPLIVAPDFAAGGNVEKISESLHAGKAELKKTRDLDMGKIQTEGKLPNLKGKELIIYDDIASSGGTLINAIQKGKEAGASKIVCVVMHPVLAYNKKLGKNCTNAIRETGAEFYASDTIDSPISKFSVIPELAEKIKEIF